jgi:hypothetical protein
MGSHHRPSQNLFDVRGNWGSHIREHAQDVSLGSVTGRFFSERSSSVTMAVSWPPMGRQGGNVPFGDRRYLRPRREQPRAPMLRGSVPRYLTFMTLTVSSTSIDGSTRVPTPATLGGCSRWEVGATGHQKRVLAMQTAPPPEARGAVSSHLLATERWHCCARPKRGVSTCTVRLRTRGHNVVLTG